MCHEAESTLSDQSHIFTLLYESTHFVILSNMDRGSRMNVGSVTLLRSAPGLSCEMIWDSTALRRLLSVFQALRMLRSFGVRTAALLRIHNSLIVVGLPVQVRGGAIA